MMSAPGTFCGVACAAAGWGFSYQPIPGQGGSELIANRIDNVMNSGIDGGAIYLQSNQIDPSAGTDAAGNPAGTVVKGNMLGGVHLGLMAGTAFAVRRNLRTPAVAIYLDHGSSNISVTDNVYAGI